MTYFLLVVAAIAAVGIVFEIVKESIKARKESSENSKAEEKETLVKIQEEPVEEVKKENIFKTIEYSSTPTPTPEFKEESKSTTADYLSYAGTTVNNEVKVVETETESETPKKKKEYKPRKPKGGKKEFKKKGKKGGDDKLLLS